MTHLPTLAYMHLRALSGAAFAILWISLSLAGLTGCKPVEIDDPPADTTETVSGTAKLRITNTLSEDPDSLVFFLFPGNSIDFSNANKAQKVGGVGENGTGVFDVPAGNWKLAFENSAGSLTAMRDLDTGDWVKSILPKDGDFSLILTNEGSDIKWNPSFATDPDMR